MRTAWSRSLCCAKAMRGSLAVSALVLASAFLLIGCPSQDAAVRETVTRYNETLADAYQRPDPELMARLVGPLEKQRITMYILFQMKQGRVLRTTLNRLEFASVNVKGNRAVVRTREDWTFQHLHKDTKRVLDKPKKIHYEATYRLLYTKGRWIVESLLTKEQPAQ